MEQEQQQQQSQEKISQMVLQNEEGKQIMNKNEKYSGENKQSVYDKYKQQKDGFVKHPISELSSYSSSSTSQNQQVLSSLSCCRHSNACRQRDNMQNNIQQFEENTTHHNTSQSSLNTSSMSCSSSSQNFEGLFFTRLPAPSSTSSTRKNQEFSSNKSRILYEEQEEDIDEVQPPSELSDNDDDQLDEVKKQNGEINEEEYPSSSSSSSNEQSQDDSYESSSFLEHLSEMIQQNSHEAKLIATGSSCQIYSLSIHLGQDSQITNIVLKTSQHDLRSKDDCNSECQKLAKEFFVLQKFSGHPYIIQAYLLENDLYLPLYNAKKKTQYFSINPPSNCCLVMEQATCDLITYFQQKLYETQPHHHYQYLQNFNNSSLYQGNIHHLHSQSSSFYSDSKPYLKNSFYNCFPGIFYDILTGLEEVHTSHQLAHNDIKPENMLFFRNSSSAKICDFEHCGQRFDMKRTDFTYQSPEIVEIYKEFRDHNRINDSLFQLDLFKNDVFSFGVTLFSTMFSFYPFCDELEKNSKDELYSLLISADADQFWQEKGISRICSNIEEKASSTYLYNFQKFIEETLEYNPSNRVDTSSLMNHDFFEEERHYRFEKDWHEQKQKQQQHQMLVNSHYYSTKYAISTKNNNQSNSHINKSQFSVSKIAEDEIADAENDCFDIFLSPLKKAESITSRARQVSLEDHFYMNRSQSFELKFDPKQSPAQPATSFTIPPTNRGYLQFQSNQSSNNPDLFSYSSKGNQNCLNEIQNIRISQELQEDVCEKQKLQEEDEKLTKTSDIDCSSSKEIIQQRNEKRIKDDFFFEDVINEADEDEGFDYQRGNQESLQQNC